MEDDELVAALEGAEGKPAASELDRIDPPKEQHTLKCGIEVRILELRTRQMFALLRVITHGAGLALQNAGLDFNDEPEVFLQKMISVVLFSIPDAAQESIEFLQSMVEPWALVDKMPAEMSKKEREHNIALWQELNRELWNPDPMDTLDIVEIVAKREGEDIQALGKRVRQFLELANRTGQLNPGAPAVPPPAPTSSARSAGRSTSSRASTGGATSTSSTSPSNGSGKSSRPSRSASPRRSAAAAR